MSKSITVEDYELVAPEFFDKYNYVAARLPENTKVEDILKIMQNLASLVLKERSKEKSGIVGFIS